MQATTPMGPPSNEGRSGSRAFWCIAQTLASAGFTTHPYRAHVPSFGEWGFVLALPTPREAPRHLAPGRGALRFLNDASLEALFAFPADMQPPDGLRINRLNDQVIVGYYDRDWGRLGG